MAGASNAGRGPTTPSTAKKPTMTTWRWVFVGVGLAAFAVVAVLIATDNASASQVADGFWVVVVVGALVQLVVSNRKRGTPPEPTPPGVQEPDDVEDVPGPSAPGDRT